MNINIKINKDGLSTKQCTEIVESLHILDTDDIIRILEGNKIMFHLDNELSVEIERI